MDILRPRYYGQDPVEVELAIQTQQPECVDCPKAISAMACAMASRQRAETLASHSINILEHLDETGHPQAKEIRADFTAGTAEVLDAEDAFYAKELSRFQELTKDCQGLPGTTQNATIFDCNSPKD